MHPLVPCLRQSVCEFPAHWPSWETVLLESCFCCVERKCGFTWFAAVRVIFNELIFFPCKNTSLVFVHGNSLNSMIFVYMNYVFSETWLLSKVVHPFCRNKTYFRKIAIYLAELKHTHVCTVSPTRWQPRLLLNLFSGRYRRLSDSSGSGEPCSSGVSCWHSH